MKKSCSILLILLIITAGLNILSWHRSADNGRTWHDLWNIHYKQKAELHHQEQN